MSFAVYSAANGTPASPFSNVCFNDALSIFDKFYKGTHILLPFVEYRQVRKFSITPYEKKVPEKEFVRTERRPSVAEELVDVDGELKGSTPLTCESCPGALRFII